MIFITSTSSFSKSFWRKFLIVSSFSASLRRTCGKKLNIFNFSISWQPHLYQFLLQAVDHLLLLLHQLRLEGDLLQWRGLAALVLQLLRQCFDPGIDSVSDIVVLTLMFAKLYEIFQYIQQQWGVFVRTDDRAQSVDRTNIAGQTWTNRE